MLLAEPAAHLRTQQPLCLVCSYTVLWNLRRKQIVRWQYFHVYEHIKDHPSGYDKRTNNGYDPFLYTQTQPIPCTPLI